MSIKHVISWKFLVVLMVTNSLSVFLTWMYAGYAKTTMEAANFAAVEKSKEKYLEFLQKDGQIYGGVGIPQKNLTGYELYDRDLAQAFLADIAEHDGGWKFEKTEKVMGYNVFVFKAVPAATRKVVSQDSDR